MVQGLHLVVLAVLAPALRALAEDDSSCAKQVGWHWHTHRRDRCELFRGLLKLPVAGTPIAGVGTPIAGIGTPHGITT